MNIWLAKLGGNEFSSENEFKIQHLLVNEFDINENDNLKSIRFDYKNRGIHYMSFDFGENRSHKDYNYVDEQNELTAYSGFFIGIGPDITDYRTAKSIHNFSKNSDFFDSNISGKFAVINASETEFQCFVDNLGNHKVFYFRDSDKNIYISNFIKLIKLFKKPELNTDAFLDWITLESILFQETEEKNIYTLPYYGILKWNSQDNSLKVHQYKHVSELVYNYLPENSLFDKVVSSFKSSAIYLSRYHKSTITLSGGYDSRLVLNTFRGLNNTYLDSYSYHDNCRDVKIAKKVAKDFGISHRVLEFSDEFPSFTELHKHLLRTNFPFFKYSEVFSFLVKNRLKEVYKDGRNGVLLKGTGGNFDRRIIERNYLDEFEENDALIKLTEHILKPFDANFFNKDAFKYLKNRLLSHYNEKYMPIISGRGKNHKLKYLLFKEMFEESSNRINPENQSFYHDIYSPLTTDPFQALIFSCSEKDLYRSRKKGIYHQLFNAFTNGANKPIHFSSGMHWEANKLSRISYRLKSKIVENHFGKIFDLKRKKTTQIKTEFYRRNRSEAIDILESTKNSFLWDYFNKDSMIEQFQNSKSYDDSNTQFIFKNVIPILKLDAEKSL